MTPRVYKLFDWERSIKVSSGSNWLSLNSSCMLSMVHSESGYPRPPNYHAHFCAVCMKDGNTTMTVSNVIDVPRKAASHCSDPEKRIDITYPTSISWRDDKTISASFGINDRSFVTMPFTLKQIFGMSTIERLRGSGVPLRNNH